MMCGIRQRIDPERLEKGKRLFFRYFGNLFHMWQDGALDEYRKLKIPKQIEDEWYQVLRNEYQKQICEEPDPFKKVSQLTNLLDLGSKAGEVMPLAEQVLTGDLDTFSRILICESLKRYDKDSHSNKVHRAVDAIITSQKGHLQSSEIHVDVRYKDLPYMKNDDFSLDNIKKRINLL
jgi:hypothetical protein